MTILWIYIPICFYFNPSSPSPPILYLFHPLSVDRITIIIILPYFSYLFYKITVKPLLFRAFLFLSMYGDFYLIRGRQLYRAYYCSGSGNNNFLSTSIDIFIEYIIAAKVSEGKHCDDIILYFTLFYALLFIIPFSHLSILSDYILFHHHSCSP